VHLDEEALAAEVEDDGAAAVARSSDRPAPGTPHECRTTHARGERSEPPDPTANLEWWWCLATPSAAAAELAEVTSEFGFVAYPATRDWARFRAQSANAAPGPSAISSRSRVKSSVRPSSTSSTTSMTFGD
jgi:hypothetical protein